MLILTNGDMYHFWFCTQTLFIIRSYSFVFEYINNVDLSLRLSLSFIIHITFLMDIVIVALLKKIMLLY